MVDDIPLFPVAEIAVGPVTQHGLVTVRFDFLTNSMQAPGEANQGRHYALTPIQARHLVEQIQRSLQILESEGPQGAQGQQH